MDCVVVTVNSQAYWKEIKRNIFKHRKQKHQDADEVGLKCPQSWILLYYL